MRIASRKAFNLLEVLVAIAIFALAAGVIAQACANALNTLNALQRDSRDDAFLRFAMRTALAIQDRDEVENGGDMRMPDDRNLTWTAVVSETPLVDLFQVEFSFELESERPLQGFGRAATHTESVYVLRPQWSDPVDRSALIQEKRETVSAARPLR